MRLLLGLLFLALPVLVLGHALCYRRRANHSWFRRRKSQDYDSILDRRSFQPKPSWVREEVIRLKALMPQAGCRALAAAFNQLWTERRGMTVGKSYVADVLRDNQQVVLAKRRELKHRKPRPLPRNVLWGLDFTYLGANQPILGVIDHGTRVCLTLREMERRTAVSLLRALLDVVERFGTPKRIRTDNEAVFTSRLFRLGLAMLGIRHERTELFAPWQNGRIERFFGTFKTAVRFLENLRVDAGAVGQQGLDEFRLWYNHLRPHQHLEGRTPAQAWQGASTSRLPRRARLVSVWKGALVGVWTPGG